MDTQTDTAVLSDLEAEFPALAEITLHDRCDSCSQHAVAIIEITADLPNLFACGHHWRKMSAAIKASGYRYNVDPAQDVLFTHAFRNAELEASGVNGR